MGIEIIKLLNRITIEIQKCILLQNYIVVEND